MSEEQSRKLYSLRELDEMIRRQKEDFTYSLADSILFLLYAHNKPIRGKIKQMKEVFLMLNEVLQDQNVQPVYFEKKQFGPYSDAVEFTIEHLISWNYLESAGRKRSKDFAIALTPKGREYISRKFHELPESKRELLRKRRIEWDTHIPSGIMNIVYTHYDEYLENSVLKKRYEILDWGDDKQEPMKK